MHARFPRVLAVVVPLTVVALSGCTAAIHAPPAAQERLIALLPMKDGFGPADHDAYEARIAPAALEHGMRRDSTYTVMKFLGGAGPSEASTVGIWTLETPTTVQEVMSDSRYQAQVAGRDRVHDMPNAVMYLAREEFSGTRPATGHPLLVGVLAMRPGFGFQQHDDYEKVIAPIAARHGMRLYRSYRVLQPMSGPAGNIVAVNIWELAAPETLGQVMGDPEYQAHVEYRDQIHDMAATTMYVVSARGDVR